MISVRPLKLIYTCIHRYMYVPCPLVGNVCWWNVSCWLPYSRTPHVSSWLIQSVYFAGNDGTMSAKPTWFSFPHGRFFPAIYSKSASSECTVCTILATGVVVSCTCSKVLTREMWVDLRKVATSHETPNFGTFQAITISKQWGPQTAFLVYGPSGLNSASQIPHLKLWIASCKKWWLSNRRYKMAKFWP